MKAINLEKISINFKRLKNSSDIPLPKYETEGSSGMDLRASVEDTVLLKPGDRKLIPTGLTVSIPRGFEGQVRPRSGLALKYGIGMVNAPGTIDSDYRGEISIILINHGKKEFKVERGDRIAQMIISRVLKAEIELVNELDSTDRGEGGFGHSGIR